MSDLHLGSRFSKVDLLLDFLNSIEAEQIILVGDIIDIWSLKTNWYWNQKHSDVMQKLLSLSKLGTNVKYIPGNHDELFREYIGINFGNIEIIKKMDFITKDGKKLLVIHGDEYDIFMRHSYRFIMHIGDYMHQFIQQLNRLNHSIRKIFCKDYWSLASFINNHARYVVKIVSRFENAITKTAKLKGYDGIICGHIHQAANKVINKVIYYNTGDWINSCTALVENKDGIIQVLDWVSQRKNIANFYEYMHYKYKPDYIFNNNKYTKN